MENLEILTIHLEQHVEAGSLRGLRRGLACRRELPTRLEVRPELVISWRITTG
jgi:hypothetical protein